MGGGTIIALCNRLRPTKRQENVEDNDDLKTFFLVVRQSLLMIVRWIEKRYPECVSRKNISQG